MRGVVRGRAFLAELEKHRLKLVFTLAKNPDEILARDNLYSFLLGDCLLIVRMAIAPVGVEQGEIIEIGCCGDFMQGRKAVFDNEPPNGFVMVGGNFFEGDLFLGPGFQAMDPVAWQHNVLGFE